MWRVKRGDCSRLFTQIKRSSRDFLRIPGVTEAELERLVRVQLGDGFGLAVSRWEHLRTYRMPHALPTIKPRWVSATESLNGVRPTRFVCGDHRENPSIQWAMASGRRAAESVLAAME